MRGLSVFLDYMRKLGECVLIEYSKPYAAEWAALYGLLNHKDDSSIFWQLYTLHFSL